MGYADARADIRGVGEHAFGEVAGDELAWVGAWRAEIGSMHGCGFEVALCEEG